ncbi:hypothetical protein [Endozoicomonas elysicola]|uniref:hypothetical protein n=1 Tax=Endozoicomonas elysicola TaxID=305900 RepID=UPI0012F9CDE7|nr:hypothetical protein [Endozoicomonas elysicola]
MSPVDHTRIQARRTVQGMVVPCSSRSTQHECVCDQPGGPPMVCAILRCSLLMWNNHTTQFTPCLAQTMGGWSHV